MSDLRGITYVMLGSQRADVGDSMRPFSRLTHMNEADVRVLLSQRGPRLFRAFHRRSQAQGLANQIRSLGLRACAIGCEDLQGYLFLECKQVNVGQGGFSAFGAEGEAPTFVPFSDVAAIVQAEVLEVVGREKVMSPKPGEAKVRTTYMPRFTVDVHRKSVPVAHRLVKGKSAMNPVVCGVPLEGPTDLARFVSLLRERCSLAVFDDQFERSKEAVDVSLRFLEAGASVALAPPPPGEEGPQAVPDLPPSKDVDEQRLRQAPAFNVYSTLWRFQAVME